MSETQALTQTLVLFGHMLVAGLIIALVLLQRGKGAEAGTGFGAGASGTVFGARGSSSFFSRATAVLATLFFATSLTLAYFSSQGPVTGSAMGDSVLDRIPPGMQAPPGDQPAGGADIDLDNVPAPAPGDDTGQ